MRYIWGMEDQYLSPMNPKRLALAMIKPKLRRFDLLANRHVTQFVANSHNVAARIRTCYQRDALVVQPGIDETYFVPAENATPNSAFRTQNSEFRIPPYLIVSALVPYKKIDLAIRTLAPTPHRPLVIIGDGPEAPRLHALAKDAPHIRFLGRQSDDIVRTHYQHCRALLFPGEEDFGLTPLEAQACGRPVIALARGGALETIAPETGLFFPDPTVESFTQTLNDFERRESHFVPATIRAHALTFTWTRFRQQMQTIIETLLVP